MIASRTAQEFNDSKSREEAYWEDRYHAVAVETREHLTKCLTYIDLNMVRAGVVKHPSKWPFGGYHEIQNPAKRYSIIDQKALLDKCGAVNPVQFRHDHKHWIDEAVDCGKIEKESAWSESIAIGSKGFAEDIKVKLGLKAIGRKVIKNEANYPLKEPPSPLHYSFQA